MCGETISPSGMDEMNTDNERRGEDQKQREWAKMLERVEIDSQRIEPLRSQLAQRMGLESEADEGQLSGEVVIGYAVVEHVRSERGDQGKSIKLNYTEKARERLEARNIPATRSLLIRALETIHHDYMIVTGEKVPSDIVDQGNEAAENRKSVAMSLLHEGGQIDRAAKLLSKLEQLNQTLQERGEI